MKDSQSSTRTGEEPRRSAADAIMAGSLAERLQPMTWLVVGVLATTLTQLRWNIGVLAWVAPVGFLLYLRSASGWRSWLVVLGAAEVTILLQSSKMITEPLPWFFALFAVPQGAVMAVIYVLFESLRRRLGDAWGLVLFPALMVTVEWLGTTFSPTGSFGWSMSNTQLENLPLLQITALVGLTGVGLLTAAVASWLAVVLASDQPLRWRRAGLAIFGLVLVAHAWGSVRLFRNAPGPVVRVAGVVSDVMPVTWAGFASPEEMATATDELFERTRVAAERGAQLVVWNEVAIGVEGSDERAFLDRGLAMAREHGIDLVVAYLVPLADGPYAFENKYVWLTPDGEAETYFKRHPMPGEGSEKFYEPQQVHDRPYGRVGGAICHDIDAPAITRQLAREGAGLVVVPSSDWKGIDPYHTQMAQVRGIEGGFAVLRPVRWATGGIYDAYGRARATLSYFEDNDRILMAQVPVGRVDTVYSRVGDVLPVVSLLVIIAAVVVGIRLWRQERAVI